MTCNCSNWDDEDPCPKHTPKLPQPEEACHTQIVIRVYRRRSDKRWYFTVVRDAIRIFESEPFPNKEKLMETIVSWK